MAQRETLWTRHLTVTMVRVNLRLAARAYSAEDRSLGCDC